MCFFTEMLNAIEWQDPELTKVKDLDPTDLKDVFREIYDLTGQSKLKVCQELVDTYINKCSKLVFCALHTTFLS